MHRRITVAALQLPTLGMNATRLEFYLKKAKERGATLMLFGEYVLNHFFKELTTMSQSMIVAQSQKHLELLKEMAKRYDMVFVAPLVVRKRGALHKTIVRVTPRYVRYYEQQILIGYPHWNEQAFFANASRALKEPMLFRHHGFKVMVMAGFEMHFDYFWQTVQCKKVDLVLLPSASTFASHNRWREIIKTQAFLHGCFVLRANRLGEYVDKEVKWKFYGDTMLVSPEGEVEMMLEDRESMLVEEIAKSEVIAHRKLWGFEKELKERGML